MKKENEESLEWKESDSEEMPKSYYLSCQTCWQRDNLIYSYKSNYQSIPNLPKPKLIITHKKEEENFKI